MTVYKYCFRKNPENLKCISDTRSFLEVKVKDGEKFQKHVCISTLKVVQFNPICLPKTLPID